MKHLYVKIFLVILVVISCSKDSDEGYGQTSSQTNVQSNTNNTTPTSTGTTTGTTTGTSTGTTTGAASGTTTGTTTVGTSQSDTFDRGSILENFSENIIIPRYNSFKSSMDDLKNSIDTFINTPNSENYDALQNLSLIHI